MIFEVLVIGKRELEGKVAKGGISFGDDQWNIPAGVRATDGCIKVVKSLVFGPIFLVRKSWMNRK